MPIRLIACDMDGTLLMPDKTISDRTVEVLKQAKQLGARISLVSGRMVESMLETARILQVNMPIIAYNGANTYDLEQSRVLSEVLMEEHIARELCAYAEGMGLHVQVYLKGQFFVAETNEISEAYGRVIRAEATPVGKPISQWIDRDQVKILIIGSPERLSKVLPELQQRFAGRINCASSTPTLIECVARGVDKGVALRALAERHGIARDEILAFGDGGNDIEMLQYAGYGYAMGNAPDRVKEAVRYIAPRNTDNGVAQTIEQFIAEGRIGH